MQSAGLATLTDVLLAQTNLEQTRASLLQAQGSRINLLRRNSDSAWLASRFSISVEDLPQRVTGDRDLGKYLRIA